jgi:hypothetical protein
MSGDVFGDDFLDALDSADPVTDDGGDTVVSEVDQHEADAERHSAGSDGADLLDVDADDQEDNDDADDQDEHPVACRFCHAGFETVDRAEAHTCPDRRAFDDTSDQVQRPSVLVPGTHELSLLTSFDGHGVAAYWDLRRTFDEDPVDVADAVDGFAFEGDCWYIDPEKTSAWRDGIAIPEDQREHCPPTDEDADTFFEFQFSVVADDPVGERKATFTVRPSFPDARKPNGDRVGGFPADAPEGVRVEINSANIHPWRVFELLGRLLEELDVDPAYVDVENLHPWSRVTQLGRYYRVLRELSEEHPVSMGGLLERISRVAPCAGGKGAHFWDDEDVTDWVRGRVSSIGDAVDTSLEDTPLLSWARRHGVDVDRGRDGLTLRIEGRRPSWYDLWNLARDAVDAAVATGSNTALEFAQTATLVYQDAEGQQVRDDSFVRYDSTQGRIVVDGVSHRTLH